MNSHQRRKARRKGMNIPYFDGYASPEERKENRRIFLMKKCKKKGWMKTLRRLQNEK